MKAEVASLLLVIEGSKLFALLMVIPWCLWRNLGRVLVLPGVTERKAGKSPLKKDLNAKTGSSLESSRDALSRKTSRLQRKMNLCFRKQRAGLAGVPRPQA